MIAADRAGVSDHRLFVDSAGYGKREPSTEPVGPINPRDLINRLVIDYRARKKLQEMI